jgi:hypothetical protein
MKYQPVSTSKDLSTNLCLLWSHHHRQQWNLTLPRRLIHGRDREIDVSQVCHILHRIPQAVSERHEGHTILIELCHTTSWLWEGDLSHPILDDPATQNVLRCHSHCTPSPTLLYLALRLRLAPATQRFCQQSS